MQGTIVLAFGMLITVSAFASFHHHKGKVNSALSAIHKVYVAGNSQAASDIRQEMLNAAKKYGEGSCFAVVGNEKAADAVLQVNEQEHTSTLSTLGSASGPTISNMVASGTLTDTKGNLLWSDSKQDDTGPFPLHSRRAGENLLRSLYHEACGSESGDRE